MWPFDRILRKREIKDIAFVPSAYDKNMEECIDIIKKIADRNNEMHRYMKRMWYHSDSHNKELLKFRDFLVEQRDLLKEKHKILDGMERNSKKFINQYVKTELAFQN